jgi:DNA-directed RNA polymerase specialized sigma24 family protein
MRGAAADMPRTLQLSDNRVLSPTESALALNLVSEMDLLRLKTIARLHARGLPPDVAWEDLLQEAFTRVLTGARRQPAGVSIVVFLAGILRSLKSEHWRRALTGADGREPLRIDEADHTQEVELCDPAAGPERSLIAAEELNTISRLFADDAIALQILAGLGEGLTAEQIRKATGVSKTDYDSARKRMRRALLREGLTCEPK